MLNLKMKPSLKVCLTLPLNEVLCLFLFALEVFALNMVSSGHFLPQLSGSLAYIMVNNFIFIPIFLILLNDPVSPKQQCG